MLSFINNKLFTCKQSNLFDWSEKQNYICKHTYSQFDVYDQATKSVWWMTWH